MIGEESRGLATAQLNPALGLLVCLRLAAAVSASPPGGYQQLRWMEGSSATIEGSGRQSVCFILEAEEPTLTLLG